MSSSANLPPSSSPEVKSTQAGASESESEGEEAPITTNSTTQADGSEKKKRRRRRKKKPNPPSESSSLDASMSGLSLASAPPPSLTPEQVAKLLEQRKAKYQYGETVFPKCFICQTRHDEGKCLQ
jgi:hypothetical protein